MLDIRNISFSYHGRQILRDVSFAVSPGEVVAVVGENGVGKTTLLEALATTALPNSGKVLLDGHDAYARPLRYRRQLGYLPEKVSLYDDMTVKRYLVYRAELKGESAKRIRRRVQEAVEMCRAEPFLRRPIGTLSAGQRKRVALADAVLLRPRVLLLDDVLAGLDRPTRDAVGGIFADAAAFSSVIVTGHEFEDLARWVTRFLVLRDGVIAASVPTAGLDPSDARSRIESVLSGGAQK